MFRKGTMLTVLMGLVLALLACAPAAPAPTPTTGKPAAAPAATSAPAPVATKAPEPTKPAAQAPKRATPPPAGQLAEIKFGEAPSFAFGPIYWALEKGYFRQEGVRVEFVSMTGTPDVVPALATGQLDMAGGGVSASQLNAHARGVYAKIVAPMGVLPMGRGPVPIVMRTDLYELAPTKTVADLKGKKVAVNVRGAVVDYILTKALEKGNLGLKDIEIVLMPFPDMPTALANRSVDAFIAAEPFGTSAVQMGVGKVLMDEIVPGKSTTVLLASPKLISERPEALRNFMVGYMRGVRDLQDESQFYTDDKMDVWLKYFKLKPEVIKAMAPYTWDPELNIQTDFIEDQQRVHSSHGLLSYQQPIPARDMVDDTFVKYARDKLGPWKRQ